MSELSTVVIVCLSIFSLIGVAVIAELHDIRKAISNLKEKKDE